MTSYLWIVLFGALALTKAQDLSLLDALDGPDEKPTPKPEVVPPKSGGGDFNILDAFGGDDKPKPGGDEKPKPDVKPPSSGGSDLNILDALGGDDENTLDPDSKPQPPPGPPQSGGDFGLKDLNDASKDGYKPDASGGSRSGGNNVNQNDYQDNEPQEAGGGPMAGIISAVAVAIFGAASSYFAYQKKKLCFKVQGGTDPESGRNQAGGRSDPQSSRNFL